MQSFSSRPNLKTVFRELWYEWELLFPVFTDYVESSKFLYRRGVVRSIILSISRSLPKLNFLKGLSKAL